MTYVELIRDAVEDLTEETYTYWEIERIIRDSNNSKRVYVKILVKVSSVLFVRLYESSTGEMVLQGVYSTEAGYEQPAETPLGEIDLFCPV